jgi:hypothetical protein
MAQPLHVKLETGDRRIRVERAASDGCHREVWEFSTYAAERGVLVLDAYDRQSRPSRRHKWRPSTPLGFAYQRLEPRYTTIKAEDVPLPDEVVEAAKQAFASKLEVTR